MLYEHLANPRQLARYKERRQTTRQAAREARRAHGSQEPTAAKMAYMKGLRKLIVSIWEEIVQAQGFHEDALTDPLRVKILERVERDAPSLIGEIGKKVSGHNARQMRRLVGIDPRIDPGTGPVIDAFREENLKLITNLTEDMFNRVGAIVKENLAGRVENLADELQDGLDFSRARANLIARDQTLKLNGQLTRVRMQNSGISEYIWTTSRDERVRPDHAELDGETFRWDNPPPPGHPGEDFQCRCTAYPIIPGLEDEEETEG